MPRPPRFEYAGAIYHVLNRGNYRSWVFEDDGAKASFQKCLFEACEFAGWTLHAYCVISLRLWLRPDRWETTSTWH